MPARPIRWIRSPSSWAALVGVTAIVATSFVVVRDADDRPSPPSTSARPPPTTTPATGLTGPAAELAALVEGHFAGRWSEPSERGGAVILRLSVSRSGAVDGEVELEGRAMGTSDGARPIRGEVTAGGVRLELAVGRRAFVMVVAPDGGASGTGTIRSGSSLGELVINGRWTHEGVVLDYFVERDTEVVRGSIELGRE